MQKPEFMHTFRSIRMWRVSSPRKAEWPCPTCLEGSRPQNFEDRHRCKVFFVFWPKQYPLLCLEDSEAALRSILCLGSNTSGSFERTFSCVLNPRNSNQESAFSAVFNLVGYAKGCLGCKRPSCCAVFCWCPFVEAVWSLLFNCTPLCWLLLLISTKTSDFGSFALLFRLGSVAAATPSPRSQKPESKSCYVLLVEIEGSKAL